MKNLTWQNPEQLFVAQELINKVKSKCCGIKGKERMFRQSEQLLLGTTKVFYKQADMWILAKDTSDAIDKMEETAIESVVYMKDSLIEISSCLSNMATYRPKIEEKNPKLLNHISDILKYGI